VERDGIELGYTFRGCDFVSRVSYRTFTDVFEEQGAGDAIFYGGSGMIKYQRIPKAVFRG